MSSFLVAVGVGLVAAAIISRPAVAFTLEYAVCRAANLAHGGLRHVGPFVWTTSDLEVIAAALAGAVAGALRGPYAIRGGAMAGGLVLHIAGSYASRAYKLALALLVLLLVFEPRGLFVRGRAQAVRA
ncbi:MAG TPA: hypothetical protein VND23_10305 [Acidimicrobiales bacterium]|nr:hypothetical protein [Acidimicrobiales bacterium]